MIEADFDFRTREPVDPLRRYASGIWYARGSSPHGKERILPRVGAVLLVVLGPPLRMTEPMDGDEKLCRGCWVTGPHRRPVLNEPTGETHVLGVTFRPAGIAALVEGAVDGLSERILRPEDANLRIKGTDIEITVAGQADAESAMSSLESELSKALQPPPDQEFWQTAALALADGSASSVGSVQESAGVSRRHFTSQLRARAGLSPKEIHKIGRVGRFLAELDSRRPIRWSEEALGAGYFDQPHAIRDFKQFTGMTPSEYVARRQEAWGRELDPGEAPGFVPELIR